MGTIRHKRYQKPRNQLSANITILIPFHDVDLIKVVWHGNYFKYFEKGRTELERLMGLNIMDLEKEGYICPIVESYCRHISPMRYNDLVCCTAWIAEVDRKFTVAYELYNQTTGKLSARGYTCQVALNRHSNEILFELPKSLMMCLDQGLSPLSPKAV